MGPRDAYLVEGHDLNHPRLEVEDLLVAHAHAGLLRHRGDAREKIRKKHRHRCVFRFAFRKCIVSWVWPRGGRASARREG